MNLFLGSAGCIFAEMLHTSPLFKGDCEISQLFCIFQILGTPNDKLWPGVSLLPNYKIDFPQWPQLNSFSQYLSSINEQIDDLLKHCLCYQPEQRFTAQQALQHSYFHCSNNNLK